MKKMLKAFCILLFLSGIIATIPCPAQDIYRKGWIDLNKNKRKDIYEDPSKPIQVRLNDLLSRMTFEEKVHQLRSWTYLDIDRWDPVKQPFGHVGHIAHNWDAAEATDRVNTTQKKQIEMTRLGIPLIIFEEALHGLKTEKATSFPQAICLASTWNTGLMEKISQAIALETRSRGIRQVLSPVVDIARDPRWGRAQETYGEDPFLVSEMAVAFCKNLEANGIITTPKHFVANSGEGGRDSWAQYYSERYLEELYFPPYKACIQRAGSRSIMPSYGTLNGIPAVADPWLLNEKARNQWGFGGFFGSDFGAVGIIKDLHHITEVDYEVAAMSINAGMDVEWPRASYYDQPLFTAMEKGLVQRQTIEEAAERILRVKFEIGLFDDPFGNREAAIALNESEDHVALALEAARQGIVLLKNEKNTLPLNRENNKTLLVVGQNARDQKLGNYSGTGMKLVSFLEGLKNHFPEAEILFHPGVESSATKFLPLSGKFFMNGTETGFRAEIFDNPDFEGLPFAVNTYKRLYIRSQGGTHGAPAAGKSWENTSMRMRADFTPDQDVEALFSIEATGKILLRVNGEEILNNSGTMGRKDGFFDDAVGQIGVLSDLGNPGYSAPYSFQKGRTYELLIEYVHPDTRIIQLSLSWDQRLTFESDVKEIHRMAEMSDAVILFPGGVVEGEFRDRSTIMYPPEEEFLINSFSGMDKPLVVVMVNGAAMAISNWERNVPAIIENWYSGQEGGNALAEIVLGKVNPSGKIPVTFPQTDGQLPLNYDHRPVGRRTGFQDPLGGKPLYPFGHGLSYTTFSYSDPELSSRVLSPGDSLTVRFHLTNTGKVAGDEISQVYIRHRYSSVVRPLKELKGFARTCLEPGETKTVSITLTPEELSIWDKNMDFAMEPGEKEIYIGASSEDIRLVEKFYIQQPK